MSDMTALREVESTLYRYARAYDEGDVGGAVDTFLAYGVMSVSTMPAPVTGRDALTAFFTSARDARRAAGAQPRHVLSNVEVELDPTGRSAHARAYMSLLLTDAHGTGVACTGVYDDQLVLTPEGWRFSERRLRFDVAPEL